MVLKVGEVLKNEALLMKMIYKYFCIIGLLNCYILVLLKISEVLIKIKKALNNKLND